MASSSETFVNKLIEEVLDVVCINQEEILCNVEKDSLLENITSEDISKDPEVIVTGLISSAIDSRMPENQILEVGGEVDNILELPGNSSVNSVELEKANIFSLKNYNKSKAEVCNVDTENRNDPKGVFDREDQTCGKSSKSEYVAACFSNCGNDGKEQLPVASCSRKDTGDFQREELMLKASVTDDVKAAGSILLGSSPYVCSAEVESIKSVVASDLKDFKGQIPMPPVQQSMRKLQYGPFSRSEANYYESSCVNKLNRIFHSWSISNLKSPKNHMNFTSSMPEHLPASFVNVSQITQDSAIPEEYSRNLPEFYAETATAMKADASTSIFNQSSNISTPNPQHGPKTSKNTNREKKRNKTKTKKKKSETSEHCSFLMYEKHTNDVKDPLVDSECVRSDCKNSNRSVDGNVCKEAKSPQPGRSVFQIAADIEEVFQTLSVQGFNDSHNSNPVSSKASKSRRKTKYITLKGDCVSPQLNIESSEASKHIAPMLVKSDINQSPIEKLKRNKKKNSNSIVQNGTPNCSSPIKSKESKSPLKRCKKIFENYWSLDAVKEGIKNGTVIESVVRINPKNYTEAYAASPNGGQDIFVEGIVDRNRALEGDLVAILLKDPAEWKHEKRNSRKRTKSKIDNSSENQGVNESELDVTDNSILEDSANLKEPQVTGKVVSILSQQHSRRCVGYLKLMKDQNQKYALFSPRDNRIPRLHIPYDKCPTDFWQDPASKKDIIYLAKIKKWIHGMFAIGEILEEVGEAANPETETTAILMDNDLDVTPFPDSFLQMFPTLPEVISEEELANREDLRKECIFTIDPMTARDLDDALSCKELENGNLEIGVHISDVSYFLKEGTPLDEEVSKRATSVYLVDKVYHMLPLELCLQCSLLPGQDRLAYSVVWEITKNAQIVSQRITRSVINSCVKLAYEHAQAMLENPDKEWDSDDFPPITNGFSVSQISKVVNHLQSIAVKLRNQRFEGGALRIDQIKLFIKLDEKGTPITAQEYEINDSNRLIEEFMLLANMSVAKFIYDKFPDIAFLRCHPEPHKWPLKVLQETLSSRGIHINIDSAGALQTSLARYAGDDFLSKSRLIVLNVLCAKTMARAKYFCSSELSEENFWHYALSVQFYTHFTSPIRRYADVMVHRLLNAALGYDTKPTWSENHVSSVAANCNKKKYSAKLAGEHSVKLFLSLYVRCHQPVIEDAVVIDVKDHSFDVNVCKFGLNMRVYVTKLNVELDYDSNEKVSAMKIKWGSEEDSPIPTIQVIELFTIVSIKIVCEDRSLKMESTLLRPSNLPLITDNSKPEGN